MSSNIPWIEKYRPKQLNDVVYQNENINLLRNIVNNNNLPHLLLYGPPGTGKTTSILIAANMLFGPKKMNERVIELNASDDRGISVVRNKIMNFAKEKLGTPDPNYPSPPFKIIILDEADAMTKEAQSALKKIIEENSKITRFCLICNYITKIIDPIQSRCSKLRFKPIKPMLMINRLKYIAQQESVVLSDSFLNIITTNAEGDMRKAIMYLQNLKYLTKLYTSLDTNSIYKMANYVNPEKIKEILDVCFNKESNTIEIYDLVNNFWKCGYIIDNILETIQEQIITNKQLIDNQKRMICSHVSQTNRNLINGADEFLQLFNLFIYIKCIYYSININDSIDVF